MQLVKRDTSKLPPDTTNCWSELQAMLEPLKPLGCYDSQTSSKQEAGERLGTRCEATVRENNRHGTS